MKPTNKQLENMSKENHGYMLLFRGNEWTKGLSPEEMQQVVNQWMAWFQGLMERGTAIAGSPLENTGKVVSGKNGRVVADGPFAESKEAIGGYFLLQVNTMEEAIAIAQQCPGLPYGAKVEVRPVMDRCSLIREVEHRAELSAANA